MTDALDFPTVCILMIYNTKESSIQRDMIPVPDPTQSHLRFKQRLGCEKRNSSICSTGNKESFVFFRPLEMKFMVAREERQDLDWVLPSLLSG